MPRLSLSATELRDVPLQATERLVVETGRACGRWTHVVEATSANKVLPTPLPTVASSYMALNQLWLGSEVQRILRQAARAVSVTGHVGNTRTLYEIRLVLVSLGERG